MEYTEQETATWTTVYTNLKRLFKTHACAQFNHILPLLEQVWIETITIWLSVKRITEFPIPSFVRFRHVLFWEFPCPELAAVAAHKPG